MVKKTDSFFIRKTINLGNGGAYVEDSIDLGAFVDALGEAVLRCHNLAVQFCQGPQGSTDSGKASTINALNSADIQMQLTTQTQTGLVLASDKSVIATGTVVGYNNINTAEIPQIFQDLDHMPQRWTHGYLIGVEQIYLAGRAGPNWVDDIYCSVVMECTVEKLTKSAALALALSQQ